uniref:40S ribosomal protein S24 n=1 Tax=Zea mays TaxID=4577 RepID=A0A804MU82_MAIZE
MARQRMVLEVIHLDHANVSKMELKERLAKMYKVKDRNTIFVFKFRAGSTGSGLIYDNLDSKKFEPKYCLIWVCCRLALPFVALFHIDMSAILRPAPIPSPVSTFSVRPTAKRIAVRKMGEVAPLIPATRRRTMSRKAAGAVEADRPAEDVSEEKTLKITIALNQEAEAVAIASKEEKGLQDEPKAFERRYLAATVAASALQEALISKSVIRNIRCLTQLFAKDITLDEKQELDEALQREVIVFSDSPAARDGGGLRAGSVAQGVPREGAGGDLQVTSPSLCLDPDPSYTSAASPLSLPRRRSIPYLRDATPLFPLRSFQAASAWIADRRDQERKAFARIFQPYGKSDKSNEENN